MPARIADIHFWKCYGVDVIPNSYLLKQNLADGIMNDVSNEDSIDKGIGQNPELASSFEKTA
jgi:hypothetical protein